MRKRKPAPKPKPATGTRGPKGLPTAKLPALPPGTILKGDQIVDRRIMPVPNYDEAMARQMYQNLMDYQAQNYAAQNATIPPSAGFAAALRAAQNAPTSPQEGFAAAQNAANIQNQFQGYAQEMSELAPIQQNPQQNAANINQAMRQYQNLLNQGAANYQAAMQQPLSPPMGGTAPTPRKPSTSSFQTPRPSG